MSAVMLTQIRRKRRAQRGARDDVHRLIIAARAQGHTLDEIAQSAGVTPQRVSQIAR